MHEDIFKIIEEVNFTVRGILCAELPVCIQNNGETVDALLESLCTTSHTLGYIVKYALLDGWLKYNDNTSPAIGAFFNIL